MARGNRALAAKRVTGPSANAVLTMHTRMERCRKCGAQAQVTRNVSGTNYKRYCVACIADHGTVKVRRKRADIRALLALPHER